MNCHEIGLHRQNFKFEISAWVSQHSDNNTTRLTGILDSDWSVCTIQLSNIDQSHRDSHSRFTTRTDAILHLSYRLYSKNDLRAVSSHIIHWILWQEHSNKPLQSDTRYGKKKKDLLWSILSATLELVGNKWGAEPGCSKTIASSPTWNSGKLEKTTASKNSNLKGRSKKANM